MNATARAAREWFGYGTWSAPYWFVGMEPGGSNHATHESWLRLGAGELIDCKAHHLDCGFTRWHESDCPPMQQTWGRLIQLLLAFKNEPTDLGSVVRYQRDRLGAAHDETALIELSAHSAVSLAAPADRMAHREERIELIRRRLDRYQPRFVIFYGRTYRREYERIVGASFGDDDTAMRGSTLCVSVSHPVARSAPTPIAWAALGAKIRRLLVGERPLVAAGLSADRRDPPPRMALEDSRTSGYGDDVPIILAGVTVGRIVRDGKSVRVDARRDDGSHRILGYYERTEDRTFQRKIGEIHAIFDAWSKAKIGDGSGIKVVWRGRNAVPAFRDVPGTIKSGCSIVEDGGVPIAYVYKTRDDSAVWIDA